MTPLEIFNGQLAAEAHAALLACCGCRLWAEILTQQRPYGSATEAMERASALWFTLAESDWLEAFAQHPRIGEVKAPVSAFLTHSTGEQAAAQETLAGVAAQLFEGNAAYEERFGFRYLVFASGRTAPELLAVLNERLGRTREEELEEAARQQDLITRLRMERWLMG